MLSGRRCERGRSGHAVRRDARARIRAHDLAHSPDAFRARPERAAAARDLVRTHRRRADDTRLTLRRAAHAARLADVAERVRHGVGARGVIARQFLPVRHRARDARGTVVRHARRLCAGERADQLSRQPIELRARDRREIGRRIGGWLRRTPRREECVLHFGARVDLIAEEIARECRIDAGRCGAFLDVGEQGVFARRIGDRLVIDPLPVRDRFGERETLRNQRDEIRERGVVAIGMRRDGGEGEEECGGAGRECAKAESHCTKRPAGRRGKVKAKDSRLWAPCPEWR
ncbi:hypothetical protein PT2222_40263 [Paraburkholderia tropica]